MMQGINFMNTQLTPMMQQWENCKKKAKDSLLFFRLGDFYEAFYEDATIISKQLDLTLTKRQNIPMCGVPFHTCEAYIDRLVSKGYKVAVAEQMEDPRKVKGIVKRDISRIVSPGTVVNSSLLSDKSNNFFICLTQIGITYGLCIVDLTTSEFKVIELDNQKELTNELCKLRPAEFLISEKFKKDHENLFNELSFQFTFSLNTKETFFFDHKTACDILTEHFQLYTLDSLGLKGMIAAINAAGALLNYLKYDLQLNISHLNSLQTDFLSSYMSIDFGCIKNLELLKSLNSSSSKNSLLDLIDKTKTSMGGRLLKDYLIHPLVDVSSINKRQDAIEEFINNTYTSYEISPHLDQIRDLERIIMKITSNYASPKDLFNLKLSLDNIPTIKKSLSSFNSALIKENLENMQDTIFLTKLINEAIVDNPPLRISDGNTFKEGYNKELDEIRDIAKNGKKWIANYQNKLRLDTEIKNLKVSFTKVFGYYIDVSKGQSNKVPNYFTRRQTLVNSERYVTEELKVYEQKVFTAEDKIKTLEQELFNNLKEQIAQNEKLIKKIAKAIANIDVLHSLSLIARENNYTRPKVDNSDILNIEEGRHPTIETNITNGSFIPNDTIMDSDNQLFLITGPNMAGKSTYIRQVALIVILAQMGSFVPAKTAHIGIIDKVFSRIGATDDISSGQSTFMVEMSETANILNNATSKSLVILDEIGRGTSTYDGISIAWAVVEYLLTTPNKKAKTLFATHYWELTEIEQKLKGAVNYNVAVKETDSGIVFLRKIVKGGTDKSYGIHVAKLAGLPFSVIKKAEEMLISLESKENNKKIRKKENKQIDLFDIPTPYIHPIIEEIKKINLNSISPMDALTKLFELQKNIK